MKLLITGHHGQVGQALIQQAAAHNFQVAAYDRSELDIANRAAVLQTVEREQPAVIINAAAYTAVDKAESEPAAAYAANAEGADNLARAAHAVGAAILHISTDYVFNGRTERPYLETDTPDPQTVYGQSKLAGEQAVQAACPRHIILRTSWLYAPYGANFMKTMLRLGKERPEMRVVFDQVGTPTSALDLARCIVGIIEHRQLDKTGLYHFSNEGVCSWYDFAVEILKLAGSDCKVIPCRTEEFPTPASRPAYSVLDKAKIKTDFNFPIPYWRDSLVSLMTNYKL